MSNMEASVLSTRDSHLSVPLLDMMFETENFLSICETRQDQPTAIVNIPEVALVYWRRIQNDFVVNYGCSLQEFDALSWEADLLMNVREEKHD